MFALPVACKSICSTQGERKQTKKATNRSPSHKLFRWMFVYPLKGTRALTGLFVLSVVHGELPCSAWPLEGHQEWVVKKRHKCSRKFKYVNKMRNRPACSREEDGGSARRGKRATHSWCEHTDRKLKVRVCVVQGIPTRREGNWELIRAAPTFTARRAERLWV